MKTYMIFKNISVKISFFHDFRNKKYNAVDSNEMNGIISYKNIS